MKKAMNMMTKDQFEDLSPRDRGYAVYMCGERKDQPNIPNEKNPYSKGSYEASEWDCGNFQAMLETQDIDD